MGMNTGESVPLVAVEAYAFESESSTLIDFMTLRTLHIRNRRVSMKRCIARRRILTRKNSDFFLSAVPHQHNRMNPRTYFHHCVKHVRKRLIAGYWPAVQLQLA